MSIFTSAVYRVPLYLQHNMPSVERGARAITKQSQAAVKETLRVNYPIAKADG
jgi:hypothetical protein